VFVGDETRLDVGYAIARERLVRLAEGATLRSTSEDAYDYSTAGLAKVGIPGLSKLVRVQVRELTGAEGSSGLAIRWEATGPGGGLFPVLDADITLAPAEDDRDVGDVDDRATVLAMRGVYRPPLGPLGQALDRAILHRVADATIRGFLAELAGMIADQPSDDVAGPPPDDVAIQGGSELLGPSAPELNA
jgi:hypothetical protein